MPPANMPPCPESLKPIQHYLSIASEHDARDPVISYWCRLYALQLGLKIDKESPEAKKILMFLMDWLENAKMKNKDNEAIIHDIPAQAHIENYTLKVFLWADSQDRASVFNKNVVKAFYTASMLYSLLETFGELTDEVQRNQKYAKWKAAYIHNCLKNGETPLPGPMEGEDDPIQPAMGFVAPPTVPRPDNISTFGEPTIPPQPGMSFQPAAPPVTPVPNTTPANIPPDVTSFSDNSATSTGESTGGSLPPEIIAKAQKYCKFASSALNYDDVPTALGNLQKAMSLLMTGRDE